MGNANSRVKGDNESVNRIPHSESSATLTDSASPIEKVATRRQVSSIESISTLVDRKQEPLSKGESKKSVPADGKPPNYPWSSYGIEMLPPDALPSLRNNRKMLSSPSPSPFPRRGHSVVSASTPTGELLLFGGTVDERDIAQSTNDLYSLSATEESNLGKRIGIKLLSTSGEVPSPRTGHSSAIVSGVLVIWGGDTRSENRSHLDNGLYLLNLVTREWTCVRVDDAAPVGRYGHASSMVGHKFYVFGGQDKNGSLLNDLWSFDLNTLRNRARWELVKPGADGSKCPAARSGHTCVSSNGHLYLFGGTDKLYHYNDTWCFDTVTSCWTELPCIGFIPSPRSEHATVVLHNTDQADCATGKTVMYIFGGEGVDGKELRDLAAFSLSSLKWFMFQNMGPDPGALSGLAMGAIDSRVFAIGGTTDNSEAESKPGGAAVHVLESKYIQYPKATKRALQFAV